MNSNTKRRSIPPERADSNEPAGITQTRVSFSPSEFARRHGISRATLYNLWSEGIGPCRINVGHLVRITVDAEQEWLRSLASANSGRKQGA